MWSGVAILAVVGAMLAFKPGPAVADGPVGGVPVAPPPTPLPSVIVYQPVSDLPEWVPSDDEALATTEAEFQSLLQQYADLPGFRGTIIVTDDPNTTETWPPVDTGVTHLRIRFRDVAYYNNVWVPQLDDGWIPGFADGQQANSTPAATETLYDLDVWQITDEDSAKIVTARVRASDGAIGFVSQRILPHQSEIFNDGRMADHCPNAGRWWWFCCLTQELNCKVAHWVLGPYWGPLVCGDCDQCADLCWDCLVDDPCHTCDLCGLSWFLRWWFGN